MFKEDDLPGVDFFSEQQINIPVGWWLTEDELNHIIKIVKNWRDYEESSTHGSIGLRGQSRFETHCS